MCLLLLMPGSDQVLVYAYCDSLPEAYSGRQTLGECILTLRQPFYYIGFYSLTFAPIHFELFVIHRLLHIPWLSYTLVSNTLSLRAIIPDNPATVIHGGNITSDCYVRNRYHTECSYINRNERGTNDTLILASYHMPGSSARRRCG